MGNIFFLTQEDVQRADAVVTMRKMVKDLLKAFTDMGFDDEQARDMVVAMFKMSAGTSGGVEDERPGD